MVGNGVLQHEFQAYSFIWLEVRFSSWGKDPIKPIFPLAIFFILLVNFFSRTLQFIWAKPMWGESYPDYFSHFMWSWRVTPHDPLALLQSRYDTGLAFQLLQALLIQPDPSARMGIWHEERVGEMSNEWDCVGMHMVMMGENDY